MYFLVFGFQALQHSQLGWVVFTFSWEVTLLSVLPLFIHF